MNEIAKILRGRKLADCAASLADLRKAEHITLIDLTGFSDIADWFVICQGDNIAHNRAIADSIVDGLKQMKLPAWHIEGLSDGRWIVLDYSDVVAHIMLPEVREFYALEELWPRATPVIFHGGDADAR